MDLSELLNTFRGRAGDRGVPPLYPDETAIPWANEAEREAAERARLLYDRTTPEVVLIPLLVGQGEYFLHPSVFDVDTVDLKRPGETDRYWTVNRDRYGSLFGGLTHRPNRAGWAEWWAVYGDATGDGALGKRLLLDRKPSVVDGELRLGVYRYPLVEMEDPGDEPEIAPRHHAGMIDWMLHRAYLTRDQEAEARVRSAEHLAMFTARFGERADANVARKQLRHRAPRVRMNRW